MLCPKCSENLSPCSKTGAHHCPSCKGYWVEPKLFATHLKAKSIIALKAFYDIRDQKAKQQLHLKCPKDKSPLYAFFYDEVELDYCGRCRGLWFDDSELDKFKAIKKQQQSSRSKPSSKKTNSRGSDLAPTTIAPECPNGHGETREWSGRWRCWKCGWQGGLAEKHSGPTEKHSGPTEKHGDGSTEGEASEGIFAFLEFLEFLG